MEEHPMTPEATPDRNGQTNLLDYADSLIWAVQGAGQDSIVAAAQPDLWSAAFHLLEDSNDELRRFGYAMALSAIIRTPNVLEVTARTLRTRLTDTSPVPWKQQLTTYESIERTIGETTIEMERDGTLWLESGERDFRIDIWQTELLALCAFLEKPEVAARLAAMRQMDNTAGE